VCERDGSYHQGTVWPWLIGPFVEALVRVRGQSDETKREAQARFGQPLRDVRGRVRKMKGTFSGGTMASILATFEAMKADPSLASRMTDPFLLSPERLAALTDTLQLTLNRELDYAIDGAVYERLQTAMEEVAASVKKQVQTQLEQKLPELIEQTLRKEN